MTMGVFHQVGNDHWHGYGYPITTGLPWAPWHTWPTRPTRPTWPTRPTRPTYPTRPSSLWRAKFKQVPNKYWPTLCKPYKTNKCDYNFDNYDTICTKYPSVDRPGANPTRQYYDNHDNFDNFFNHNMAS